MYMYKEMPVEKFFLGGGERAGTRCLGYALGAWGVREGRLQAKPLGAW